MNAKQLLSLFLIFLMIAPPTQGWSQVPVEDPGRRLEDQARFHLQRITPAPGPGAQLPPVTPSPPSPPPEPAKILTTAPRQPEEFSAAEKRADEYGLAVRQFGYSFFYKPPETFLPVQAVPVGPDYIIGPGDSVRIVLWGNVQGEYHLTVDRNGQIAIPKVGVVHVSGLTFRQLREVLDREFSRQYTNFQMNVTLDNLRTIQVYVVGQARFPGSYAVSSLSTLVSALFAAGGPSKSGSMRHIQVRRGGKVIVNFDMYDFLLKGDKSKDIRLQPEDVIFIPPIGPLAAIGFPKMEVFGIGAEKGRAEMIGVKEFQTRELQLTDPSLRDPSLRDSRFRELQPVIGGPVKVPGIYELKNEKTLIDLLKLAGGLAETAFKGRVQVLRIKNQREMVLFEDDLEKVLKVRVPDVPLVDGDMVKIFRVPDLVEKKVRVAGAVKVPGEFGLYDNMRVKDLINYAGGLLLQANMEEAEITRVTITPQGPETTRVYVNLRRAMSGAPQDNLLLKPNDYLFVRTVPEWELYKTVKIEGEVKFAGTYAIKKGETLSSVLARAGGFSEKAYPYAAIFTRVGAKEIQKKQLKEALDRAEAQVLALSAQKAAAGLEEAEAKRQEIVSKQQLELLARLRTVEPTGRVVVRLDDPERLRGTPADIELQEGDHLYVPLMQQTVNLVGAVFHPSAIIHTPYLTVKEYIAMAGGTTKIADDKEIYVIKANGSAVSRKGFKWFGSSWDGTGYTFHVGGLSSLTLSPGDTIVVPEEIEKIYWLKEIKDVAIILGQIALTAGVVLIGLRK